MKEITEEAYPHISDPLFAILKIEFNGSPEVYHFFDEFFRHRGYDRVFALKLIETSRGDHADSWDIRRLAALMLEHQILSLSVANVREFDFLLEIGRAN